MTNARTRSAEILLVALAIAAWPAAGAAVPAPPVQGGGGFHENDVYGFKLKPPQGWTEIPVQVDEGWLIAKWLSDKTYHYTEKGGWTYEFKPELAVIAFVSQELLDKAEEARRQKAKEELEDGEDEGGVMVITGFETLYKDYKEYLDATYQGGGFYFSKEEQGKCGDLATEVYEIKVEKMARDGPKRIVTWVYHLPDVDIAVQLEVLEDSFAKLTPTIDKVLKSFKPIPRKGALPTDKVGGSVTVVRGSWRELTPDQRRQRLLESEVTQHRRAIESLPEGWTHSKEERFLVLNHADEQFAKRVVEQGNEVFEWLEKTFAFVGPREYVRAPILRLCKDQDEERSFSSGGGGGIIRVWSGFDSGLEIVMNKESSTWGTFEYEWLNRRLLDAWFEDKDRELWWGTPFWLRLGLLEFIGMATTKSGKLDFRMDVGVSGQFRGLVREGRQTRPRDLVRMTSAEIESSGGSGRGDRYAESAAFMHFLLAGPASRSSDYKGIVPDYLKNLAAVVAEIEAEERAKKDAEGEAEDDRPQTEEEEEAEFKRRQEEWKGEERQKRVLDRTFERTFAGWSDAEWDAFEKAYFKSMS